MQRPHAAERRPGQIEIQRRPCKLRSDDQPHRKSCDAPNDGCDGCKLDRPEIVVRTAVDLLRRKFSRTAVISVEDHEAGRETCDAAERCVEREWRIMRARRTAEADE